ncbi:MAG TPA: transposase [Abditibacteriaceae bacterium]|nr:transposase [Abditibacteriaceae bacterium]
MRLADSQQDWVIGHQDEVWFSRLATPHLHAWTAGTAMPLQLKTASRQDPDPKALSCYGLWREDTAEMMLRFVEKRPVSSVTTQFLHWLGTVLAAQGKKVLLMFWDNASWHVSKEVTAWLKAYNRHIKKEGGCRLLVCRLPLKSPWLNPIEAKWVHGKKNTVAAERILSAAELKQRLCLYYGCPALESIKQ